MWNRNLPEWLFKKEDLAYEKRFGADFFRNSIKKTSHIIHRLNEIELESNPRARASILFFYCFLQITVTLFSKNILSILLLYSVNLALFSILVRNKKGFFKIFLFSNLFLLFLSFSSSFNFIIDGKSVVTIINPQKTMFKHIINYPITITKEGLLISVRLFLRTSNSIFSSLLLIYSSNLYRLIKEAPLKEEIKSLLFLILINIKRLFLKIENSLFSNISRSPNLIKYSSLMDNVGLLLTKLYLSAKATGEEISLALISRGYNGRVSPKKDLNFSSFFLLLIFLILIFFLK